MVRDRGSVCMCACVSHSALFSVELAQVEQQHAAALERINTLRRHDADADAATAAANVERDEVRVCVLVVVVCRFMFPLIMCITQAVARLGRRLAALSASEAPTGRSAPTLPPNVI